jgi:5S rRNA maturation endonuclease (ribonuclease M5)
MRTLQRVRRSVSGNAYELVTRRLAEKTGWHPTAPKGDWRCPGHLDNNASLSVSNGDGRVLIHCHAGCDLVTILDALGLKKTDLFDEERPTTETAPQVDEFYDYVDENGDLLYQVVRSYPKKFRQRRPDGQGGWLWQIGDTRRVPYRLPEIRKAVGEGLSIWIAEGEKDVHALERAGCVATCNPGGAGKWKDEYSEHLRGATEIVVVQDKDGPGKQHAQHLIGSLKDVQRILIVEALTGKDAADHLGAGHTLDEFTLINEWPEPAEQLPPSTWQAVDIAALRAGGLEDTPPPLYLARTDGLCLVYAGKTHSFNGESESGKTWGACICCAEAIHRHEHVLYIDFEDDANGVTSRMLALGCTWDQLEDYFHYIRPEEPIADRAGAALPSAADLETSLNQQPTVCVLDGVTEAMDMHDLDPLQNRDSARFHKILVRPIARSGAAVIQIDHVVKDKDNRGNYALGAQHKRAAITGAQYTFEVHAGAPLGRGKTGVIHISVNKDRPGHVRRHATGKKIGTLRITSNDDGTHIDTEFTPPDDTQPAWEKQEFRPTHLMEKASRIVELNPGSYGKNQLKEQVGGKAEYAQTAIDILVREGYLRVEQSGAQRTKHYSEREYREATDTGSPSPNRVPTESPEPVPRFPEQLHTREPGPGYRTDPDEPNGQG